MSKPKPPATTHGPPPAPAPPAPHNSWLCSDIDTVLNHVQVLLESLRGALGRASKSRVQEIEHTVLLERIHAELEQRGPESARIILDLAEEILDEIRVGLVTGPLYDQVDFLMEELGAQETLHALNGRLATAGQEPLQLTVPRPRPKSAPATPTTSPVEAVL